MPCSCLYESLNETKCPFVTKELLCLLRILHVQFMLLLRHMLMYFDHAKYYITLNDFANTIIYMDFSITTRYTCIT